ncbi:MAG: hypothetical protein Q4B26_00990 [Eubacteriales bacterium]|nr:hypothetical protein [Eubacteriales bacterium]
MSKQTRFNVGETLSFTMLYGGHVTATITSRSKDSLVLKETWIAEDTGSPASASTLYPILLDNDSKEYIEIWEYHGEHGVIYAGGTI